VSRVDQSDVGSQDPDRVPATDQTSPASTCQPQTFDAWIRRNWWCVLLPITSFGWLTWLSFVYAGARAREWTWFAFGVAYGLLAGLGFALVNAAENVDDPSHGAGISIALGLMGGGLMHGLAIRKRFEARCAEIANDGLDAAERRRSLQRLGRRIALEEPLRARELGVGRPDLRGAFDAELVDLNSAPAGAIAAGCGVDPDVAARIVRVREQIGGGFASLEDMDLVLDLPVPVLERLRTTAVFVGN
jgi:hypothetical protein